MTTIQPDWLGLGLAGNVIDPLGNVSSLTGIPMAWPTVTVDQVNRNTQYTYDHKGNVTTHISSRLEYGQYTYNSDSEPLTSRTDANSHTPRIPTMATAT